MKKIVALLLIAVMSVTFISCGAPAQTELRVLNWGEYMDPELIEAFETANPDINITLTTVTSNEEMYTICTSGDSQIDLLFPADYMLERMINEDLLAELDFANIPNYSNVEEFASNLSFDPDGKYTVPYMYAVMGIVYNSTLVDDEVTSWDILWDEKYSKQMKMYDHMRATMGVALSMLGYSINSTDPAEIAEAEALLTEQRPLVLAYGTDDIKTDMVGGSLALAMDYSGAAAAAIMENPDLRFVLPEEPGNIGVDCMVVLKSSKNKEAAEKFINFLTDTENAKKNASYIGYLNPNPEVNEYLLEEYDGNTGFALDPEAVANCTYHKDLTPDELDIYNDAWLSAKAAS